MGLNLKKIDFKKLYNEELGNQIKSRSGEWWSALSPFRGESSASFSCNIAHGGWRDHGGLDEGKDSGDVIKFIELHNDCSRGAAIRYIGKHYGIT